MLLRLQPCEWSLLLVLLAQTVMVLVESVPATRSPGGGGRRRSTTSTTSTVSPTAPICVDPSTTVPPPPTTTPSTGPPTTSLAATNSTWPKQWVGPVVTPPTSAPSGALPPGGGAGGGNVRDNLVEDDEDDVTCYTCVNVSDNIICNKYAIDVPCPKGEDFCHTLHIVDSRGQSVLVNKKCAVAAECDPAVLGCLHIDTQTVCASCCDESYCNETVPTNRTASFYSSTRSRPPSAPTSRPGAGAGAGAGAGRAAGSVLAVAAWLAAARASC